MRPRSGTWPWLIGGALIVLFIFALVPDIDCIVKESLLRNPVLRWPIRWAQYIPAGAPQRHAVRNYPEVHAFRQLFSRRAWWPVVAQSL